ncbi:MAG: autotransporter-associated beta strand repeat-containing protein [Moraxellaceae bacterium]|nr:autotransporter-associated beta strand repeat-containing protein [Moraxellaceae bacterium]
MLAKGTALETAADVTAKQTIHISEQATLDTAGHNSSLSGIISGTGSIDKVSDGRLALEGINTFDGSLNVAAGRVAINNANSLGIDSNSVMLAKGTALETAADVTAKQTIHISEQATLDTAGHNSSLSGIISGTGSIDKVSDGRLALEGINTFDGSLNVAAGRVAINNANSLGHRQQQRPARQRHRLRNRG